MSDKFKSFALAMLCRRLARSAAASGSDGVLLPPVKILMGAVAALVAAVTPPADVPPMIPSPIAWRGLTSRPASVAAVEPVCSTAD